MTRNLCILFLFCFITNTFDVLAQPNCLGTQGQLKWLLWENLRDDELDDLTHLPSFPNNPTAHEIITGLKSPGVVNQQDDTTFESVYYGTYYGSMIRGYLLVPESGTYSFNITGDDEVRFLLSTDATRENLVSLASVSEWTYRKEFAKEANQTSPTITLNTNTYYYFEVWHKEHSGGDHVEVLWKTPSNSADWQDIPSQHLFDYACSYDCPPSGTACDDGNANTIQDMQDGFCNCIGTPISKPSCVGKKGEIKAMYYKNIPGSSMSSFLDAEKYPLMPDTVEILSRFQGPLVNRDEYGTKIAGFISVPVTGAYQFSVTCDDRASFAISTDETPDNLVQVSYSNWSSEHDHYDEVTQVQAPVNLNKDQFYYFEAHHREGGGGDRYSVFWRTPFSQDTLWRYLDDTYVYGYACELACIPEGTPCDDGNNFTKNDQYDADCNCVGTPCRDCDESEDIAYTPTKDCGVSDYLDNSTSDAWESCTPQPNPNAARGTSHWIQYDLGEIYLLNGTHIWNYNGEGETRKGFKNVVIDYSSDGTNWTQLGGMYEWQQATGTVGYTGFSGPDFGGITARYILITALNNWDNGACAGFSKITIEATDCLLMGQSCDDGDPNSVNDRYDANCNCIGEGAGLSACGEESLVQNNVNLTKSEYRASSTIVSKGIISSGADVTLIAGTAITLDAGFYANEGSTFLAMIGACEEPIAAATDEPIEGFSKLAENGSLYGETKTEKTTTPFEEGGKLDLTVFPNPANSWATLRFNLPYIAATSLCIYATDGKKIVCLANDIMFSEGSYAKEFPAHRLTAGMYYVVLKTEKEVLTKPLIVIE